MKKSELTILRLLIVFSGLIVPAAPVFLAGVQKQSSVASVMEQHRGVLSVRQQAVSVLSAGAENPSSATSWELEEEEAIVKLYAKHYATEASRHPIAVIASGNPGKHLSEESVSFTAISGSSTAGVFIDVSDCGSSWPSAAESVISQNKGMAAEAVALSYYSIRQGYANPDQMEVVSVIAKVRRSSV